MEPKIIIIGLNPSKARAVIRGSALNRLNQWADQIGLPIFSFTNLTDDPDWDFKFKSLDQNFILQSIVNYDIIVALGTGVANHLKKLGLKDVFVLPHPSPRNRQLNDPAYIKSKLSNLREYIDDRLYCYSNARKSA
jgi:hypothetical protein